MEEKVMVTDARKIQKNSSLGKIIAISIPAVTYMVEAEGFQWKRHVNQQLKCGQNLE